MNVAVYFILVATFSISWCGSGFAILRSIWPHGTMPTSGITAIWLVVYFSFIGLLVWAFIRNTKSAYREFTLDWCRVDDDRFDESDLIFPTVESQTFHVPEGTKEFWINLEDTDKGVKSDGEVVYYSKAKFYLNRKEMPIGSNDDCLHVVIDKVGNCTVKYLSNYCTTGESQWSLSEVRYK